MFESTSTTTRVCLDCQAEFATKSVRNAPKRCDRCREVRKKRLAHEAMDRFLDRTQPDRTADPVCKRCEKSFERANSRGRRPDCCPPCVLEIKRAAGRAYMAKAYVKRVPGTPETFTCVGCDQPFEHVRSRGRTPERCRSCLAEKERIQRNELRRLNGRSDLKFNPGERTYPCAGCGTPMPHAATGRRRVNCDACVDKQRVEAAAALRLTSKPPINCIDCEVEVPVGWHGPGGRKRCDTCAKKKARAIQKRMANERRAWKYGADSEKFEDIEIFIRDGWRCGLCHKKIDKRLKHPHMMAATVDHVLPYTKGGHHVRTNVIAAHRLCNQRKYNRGGGEQLMIVG